MSIEFSTGSGFSAGMIIHELAVWLQGLGLGHRSANLMHARLTGMYGAAYFRVHKGHVQIWRPKGWETIVHRDDVRNFLYGVRLPIKVGEAPDPSEQGVKISVGVMDVEVTPGEDGVLGTDDDEVGITPKTAAKAALEAKTPVVEYEELKDGRFQCEACGKTLKTEKGIIAHIERDH